MVVDRLLICTLGTTSARHASDCNHDPLSGTGKLKTQDDHPLLFAIRTPSDLRRLPERALGDVARQLRRYLVESVSQSGGHFAAGLGAVELTIALHYLYDTPHDRIVWDVGHQSYPHKILTGRRERMHYGAQVGRHLAISQAQPRAPYDTFGVGHAGTSIGAAAGMAIAAQRTGSDRKVVAVIGDGGLTCGMAFEALNHAGGAGAGTCSWCSTTTRCRSRPTSVRSPTGSPSFSPAGSTRPSRRAA